MRRTRPALHTIALAASLAGWAWALPACATALLTPHVPAAVAQHAAQRIGAPAAAQRLTLAIALPMRDQPGLTALLQDLYRPGSPRYRHYLSVADFTARFGPTARDYAAATDFFRACGLRILATSTNRAMIDADGAVADIERVFHTTIGQYRDPATGWVFMAPDREPTLDLAVPVLHVTGLDNAVPAVNRMLPPPQPLPSAGTGSGPNGSFIGSDIRAAYYGGGSLTGAGQSLGLMELGAWNPADVTLYFSTVQQPLNVPIIGVSTDGSALNCVKCSDAEQAADIEYAISMAPGLSQVQVYVGKSAESVLNRMASDNTSKQLSTSWGWANQFATDDPLFREMAAQGQTFLAASGDYATLKASGPWPEEDANLTAVGGTDLVTAGASGAWLAETAWPGSAGGPSLNLHIKIPSYQLPFINAANAGSHRLRNVPDVAADADFENFICFGGSCGGSFGGTSFAAPIWAGIVALMNQQAAMAGKPAIGFLNPTLYAVAGTSNYAKLLNDITQGTNGTYNATINYDLVTGLGSPQGAPLAQQLNIQP